MKASIRFISLLLVCMLLPLCVASAEDIYPEPILFLGLPWGINQKQAVKALPKGAKIPIFQKNDRWRRTEGWLLSGEKGDDDYRGEIGCYGYVSSSTIDTVQFEGYQASDLYMYFLFDKDDEGNVPQNLSGTSLIRGAYYLTPEDTAAAYADLTEKLTALYGDVDGHQTLTEKSSYEQNIWKGAEGTVVSLVLEENSKGRRIIVKYTYLNADNDMENILNALQP